MDLEKNTGEIEVIGAYINLGRYGNLTNSKSVKCPVDLYTHVSGPGVYYNDVVRSDLDYHPDGKVKISNIYMKDFDLVKELCVETLRKLPHTRFAGFDIGMSSNGPVVVEINVQPDKDGAAWGMFHSNKLLENL